MIFILFKLTNKIPRNEFERHYKVAKLSPIDTIDLIYNSFYIAGSGKTNVYLGNTVSQLYILKYDLSKQDSQHFSIKSSLARNLKSAHVSIDSPLFYLQDILLSKMIQGVLNDTTKDKIIENKIFFADAISISNSSNIIRTFKNNAKEYVLAKSFKNDNKIIKNNNILKKQLDGLFCTDGMLHYSQEYSTLLYLYFYRNEFIQIDTNLSVIKRCNTIDSNYHAKIQISKITSSKSITMSAPPFIVNKRSKVNKDKLYVLSPLLSKNEPFEAFIHASTIDVYNFTKCSYDYSLQIPDYLNKKITDFEIKKDKAIILFEHYLLIFNINDNQN